MQTVAMKGTDNKDTAGSMDAPAQSIRMTVFAIDDLKDWQNRIVEAVNDGAAARVCRRGGGCAVWSPRETARLSGTDLSYVDGACIVRQRIGRQAGSLGIIPRRMYFEGGAEIPSSQPEWRLMDGRRAPRAPATDRLQQCLNWAQHISRRVPGFSAEPMRVVRVRRDLHKSTKLVFGAGKTATAGCKTSEMILRHGFRSVPNNLRIEIASPAAAMDQARRYRTLLADAFKRCHCHGSLGLIGYDILGSRLIAGASPDPGSAILLAITGKKGLPLSEEAAQLVARMSRDRVPFRMFSADNLALQWSALDQAGSILMSAGGVPYVLELPWQDIRSAPFILGVDLGHPMGRRISRVALSLLDSQGVHIESWRCLQGRDETIGPQTLQRALKWAVRRAASHSGLAKPSFLVLRDGRLFQGERFEIYGRVLGSAMTFVEIAKYDNPEMYVDGPRPVPVAGGTECWIEGGDVRFLSTVAPRLQGDLPRTFKLEIDPVRDGLSLGHERIAEIIAGLSYSPGLGLSPHALPGPIYWADGVAAIGDLNHQFSGQPMVEATERSSDETHETGRCETGGMRA